MRTKVKKKKTGLFVLFCVILVVAGLIAFVKIQFEIKTITIEGSSMYTYDELYDYIFEDRNDKNLILFKYTDSKADKPDIPFVAKVAIDIKWPGTINIQIYEKNIIGYVKYQGAYMYFDKDGVVAESSYEYIDGVPLISGLDYSSIIVHQKLEVDDTSVFESIYNIKQYMERYNIEFDEIQISDESEFSVDIDEITVLLGKDNVHMGEKIYELSRLMSELAGRKGTLDMKEYDGNTQYIILTEEE